MSKLEEMRNKRMAKQAETTKKFIDDLNKIDYIENIRNTKASASVYKKIEDKIYFFEMTIYENESIKYTLSIKNNCLESAYYNKEYINTIPAKWSKEFKILADYIESKRA